MVHAYKGWTHHEVGPVDMSTIWETWDVALELGFFLKPLSDLAGGEMSEPAVPTEGGHIIGIARKTISRLMRFSGFILVSLLLYWLFWGILALARVLKPFQYLFLVYPGTDSDLDAYCPRRIAKSRLLKNKAFIGGLISRGPGGRGLVLVTPSTIENFSQDGQARKEIMGRLEWIGRVSGAGAIALAGQLPGIIYRNGNSLQRPFVRGDRGTVFCVMETLDQIMKNHNLNRKSIRIAVVGVGHVGGILLDALRNEGLDTVGIDIELKRGGIVLQKEGERLLQDIDVVIVLTPRGNDFLPYLKFVKKDAIILDDTHPKIKQNDQPKNLTFYKVAVGIENTRFYPRLPGYRPNWIPGCVVDAMVAAATGNFNGIQQIEFNEMAKKLGFFALMVK
jgi:hypothetical protein